MFFIAHRGLYNDSIGENTISAFDNAWSNAFDGIELDVRKTKDKKIVVIHDSFISRVSNGSGLVKHHNYSELLKYNFGKASIERIPLLEQVLCRYQNKLIMIELKEDINISDLNLNSKNNYYISSFNYDYIKKIPENSNYKRGIINNLINTNINLENIDFIMILEAFFSKEVYDYYTSKNIEVIIYGIGNKINLNLFSKDFPNIKCII